MTLFDKIIEDVQNSSPKLTIICHKNKVDEISHIKNQFPLQNIHVWGSFAIEDENEVIIIDKAKIYGH